MDLFSDLSGSFETGLSVDEKKLLHLRARSAALTFCGCAHAAFVCELVHTLTRNIRSVSAARDSVAPGADCDLRVGILGLGHLGKQLLICLLHHTSIKHSHIKISTRNPETHLNAATCVAALLNDLGFSFLIRVPSPDLNVKMDPEDCVPTGVECFFDNHRLAVWADVLFLCCLPSHLPRVCSDLKSHLSKCCLVYSFPSAVPVTSLAERLGHSFVLKPKYEFESCDSVDVWLTCSHLTTAFSDPSLREASCPLTMKDGITLGLNWVCGVMYSLLNICTSSCLGSGEALSLINGVFNKDWINNERLEAQSFISSSCASVLYPDEPFPWISLIDAQTKETPLLRFVSSSEPVQQCICAAYKSFLQRAI